MEIHQSLACIGFREKVRGLTLKLDGVLGEIRKVFAATDAARALEYRAGHFSFNVKGGRCEVCEGDGAIRVEMQFLPDAFVPCEVCMGRRYDRETLAIRYRGKSIADVLEMTVE